ncbi:SAM-dependent methyltransferase [Streptomonospora sediminis]
MNETSGTAGAPSPIDTTVVHSARVWNYWLGGKDNYAVDREVGAQIAEQYPVIIEVARQDRAFLRRAIRYLAGEAGVRQFLDVGTGMPTHNSTHEVAQAAAPDSAVVYVDYDPLVLAHATALLTSTPEGFTDYVHADLRKPDTVLAEARKRLDFDRPIALSLMGILGHIPDDQVYGIVARLVGGLPPGSYLALCEGSNTDPEANAAMDDYNQAAPLPYRVRSPEDIAAFFNGLEMVEPGLVACPQWRPDDIEVGQARETLTRCGIGRKADAS